MNPIGEDQLSALQRAIETDAAATLDSLIDEGVALNQKVGDRQVSLMEFVIEKNAVECARCLIVKGFKLKLRGNKPLMLAVGYGRTQIVKLMLEAGADPNITFSNPDEGQRGETVLMAAVAIDAPERNEIAKLLLQHGANPHLTTNKGNTALYDAVDIGNFEAAKMLLAAGCKPTGPILQGPIYRGGDEALEIFKLLVAAGADLNVRGTRDTCLTGRTPMQGVRQMLRSNQDSLKSMEGKTLDQREAESFQRWKAEEKVYREMMEILTRAGARMGDDDPLDNLSVIPHLFRQAGG